MFSAKFFNELNNESLQKIYHSALWKKAVSEYYFLPASVKYYSEYHSGSYTDSRLVILHNETPVLIFFSFHKEAKLSYFQFPVSVFTADAEAGVLDEAYRLLLINIGRLSEKYGIDEIIFYADPYLTAEFFPRLIFTGTKHFCVIDLALSEEAIRKNIRKSYKSLVNWGIKNLSLQVMESANADEEAFKKFQQFHVQVAGRITRNDDTWQTQFEMIKNNEAFLVTAGYESRLVSANLVLCGRDEAFYGVGVNDRALMEENKPVSHYPLLYAVLHAKKTGLKIFNMNEIDRTGDAKADNISKFKQGFSSTLRTKTVYTAKING